MAKGKHTVDGEAAGASAGRTLAVVGLLVGAVGIIASLVMGVLYFGDGSSSTGGMTVTADGFVVEPADSVGPDAFTPPFATSGGTTCDKAKFLRELQSRPDAIREWAAVLGVPQEQVAAYVATLEPRVLNIDTAVTNHGLHDGHAYARPSILKAGTTVLMGHQIAGQFDGEGVLVPPESPSPSETPQESPSPTPTPSATPSTSPGPEVPVTRCRCGNPLLPPYSPPATTTTTTTTASPTPTPTQSPGGGTTQRRRTPTPTPSPTPQQTTPATPAPTQGPTNEPEPD